MQLNTLGLAHEFLRRSVRPGDVCVDATAGRGRDTALLCRLAGADGRVLAFDVQPEAVRQTRALLAQEGLRAEVYLDSHANLLRYLPPESVQAVVFNLGRLPGGDPHIFTTAGSTLPALSAAAELLRPGGVISLSVYYGGPNGYAERDAVLSWLRTLDDRRYTVLAAEWANRRGEPPLPVFIWRER